MLCDTLSIISSSASSIYTPRAVGSVGWILLLLETRGTVEEETVSHVALGGFHFEFPPFLWLGINLDSRFVPPPFTP